MQGSCIYLRLARSRDPWVVSMSIGGLMGVESIDRHLEPLTESVPAVDVLISIADGPNRGTGRKRRSARSAITGRIPKITQFLRRKMTDSNKVLSALKAAIITCYSGDWSGFPLLLRVYAQRGF